jgi:hypothetical protein
LLEQQSNFRSHEHRWQQISCRSLLDHCKYSEEDFTLFHAKDTSREKLDHFWPIIIQIPIIFLPTKNDFKSFL